MPSGCRQVTAHAPPDRHPYPIVYRIALYLTIDRVNGQDCIYLERVFEKGVGHFLPVLVKRLGKERNDFDKLFIE